MPRTGARLSQLAVLLTAAGFRPIPSPSHGGFRSLGAAYQRAVADLYAQLDGRPERLPMARPGGWDLAFEDGLIVELDEEQHFNRYRAETLESPETWNLPWSSPYRAYSSRFEDACLKGATGLKFWTSPSSEAFFGPSSAPGDLRPPGSARWKQRAFYDAMKDLADGRVLARVSVHDEVNGVRLERILRGTDLRYADDVAHLVVSRIHGGPLPGA